MPVCPSGLWKRSWKPSASNHTWVRILLQAPTDCREKFRQYFLQKRLTFYITSCIIQTMNLNERRSAWCILHCYPNRIICKSCGTNVMLTALLWCLFVQTIVQKLRNKSALHQQSSVTIGFQHLSGTQKPDGCFFYAHIFENEIYESQNSIHLLHGIRLPRGLLSVQKYTVCIFYNIEESPNGKAWAFDTHIVSSTLASSTTALFRANL